MLHDAALLNWVMGSTIGFSVGLFLAWVWITK
jgi:hypothetical protein